MGNPRKAPFRMLPASPPAPETGTPAAPGQGSIVAGLFATQVSRIRRLIQRRLHSAEDAQDATQEAFLKLWKREQEGALREDAQAYLHAAARTVVIDLQRHRKSHAVDLHVELMEEELPSASPDPEDPLHWRKGLQTLVYSLQELPELTQQVFILYHFEGMSHKEIARQLAVSVRSVERHMAQALAHSRVRLKDYL